MNMHGIVAGYIGAVNPLITIQIKASTGYTKDASFKPVPSYAAPVDVVAQVQALTFSDLRQLDSLNIQGNRRGLYLPAPSWNAVSRVDVEGGDLARFPEWPGAPERVWLLAHVLENWPDWVKVAVTLQVDEAWA